MQRSVGYGKDFMPYSTVAHKNDQIPLIRSTPEFMPPVRRIIKPAAPIVMMTIIT